MTLRRRARADWTGDAYTGAGTVTVDSGAFDPQVITLGSRERELPALTSPEELLAAAQAACLTLTIVTLMEENRTGPPAFSVEACCEVSFEGGTCAVRRIQLTAWCPPTADAGAVADRSTPLT